LTLASMVAPFAGGATEPTSPAGILGALPGVLWLTLPGLPAAAAAIGYITAQGTVRRWLRRLP
jgi:cell division transport system permease protein